MSIEERLGNAILDLEGRLAEGLDCKVAIRETAADYDLKDEALRLRAIKLLGPLELIKEKVARRVEAVRSENAFRATVDAYTDEDADVPMRDWLVQRLGREPSQEELMVAFERSTERWFSKHWREFQNENA